MKNKKAISEVVGYVLLISITIALSVLVFGWLKFYVNIGETEKCPEGVSLVIRSYNCSTDFGGRIAIVLQNKGLFNVAGFSLKVNDASNATIGVYELFEGEITFSDNGVASPLAPGNETSLLYLFSDFNLGSNKIITLLEVQPIVETIDKKNLLHCGNVATQKIVCS